ncbi:MAG: UDP-N-acetylmuramate dehydrogenase [Pseudomonadota bacterium]
MSLADLPPVRGKLLRHEALAPFTWFRVGGAAEVLFLPADADDLAAFLAALPEDAPLTMLGFGSNTIVRDGGVPGVVVRLAGKAFAEIRAEPGARLRAGCGALDANVARAAAKAGIAGLEFFVGVPGSIGGALAMNAGCYGRETRDVLVEAVALDPKGQRITLSNADFGFSYRKNALPPDLVFLEALFQGEADAPEAVEARMAEITAQREAAQPIREKTGGSTFKNPPGENAWRLIDRAGYRGRSRGGAQVSEKHCNFLINTGAATAADIEGLGEEVRGAVKEAFGIDLTWEIKRIGTP